MGRSEERFSGRGAPVDQQTTAVAVGEAEPPDIHGVGVVRTDHASQAHVETVATQSAQASGQPVDLHVSVHRRLTYAAGCLARGVEAVG